MRKSQCIAHLYILFYSCPHFHHTSYGKANSTGGNDESDATWNHKLLFQKPFIVHLWAWLLGNKHIIYKLMISPIFDTTWCAMAKTYQNMAAWESKHRYIIYQSFSVPMVTMVPMNMDCWPSHHPWTHGYRKHLLTIACFINFGGGWVDMSWWCLPFGVGK